MNWVEIIPDSEGNPSNHSTFEEYFVLILFIALDDLLSPTNW
jgi:hypothetical protein